MMLRFIWEMLRGSRHKAPPTVFNWSILVYETIEVHDLIGHHGERGLRGLRRPGRDAAG